MADKRCPHCNRWNSEAALLCDCGFDFSTNSMSATPAKGNAFIASPWRAGLMILGFAIIPGFVLAAFLVTRLRRFSPLLVADLLAIFVLFPTFWLPFFTRLEKNLAKYFMLVTGLACAVMEGLVIASFILRVFNPQ